MKKCTTCEIFKDINDFYIDKRTKDGHLTQCKDCIKEKRMVYKSKNQEKIKEINKKYYNKHKERLNKQHNEYIENNKETLSEKAKERYRKGDNKEKQKDYNRKYYLENKENILKNGKEYYNNHKEESYIRKKKWSLKNKVKIQNNYKNRLQNDLLFRIKEKVRHNIKNSIKSKGFKKNSTTAKILGCTYIEFKEHIEKQFEPWMNWDNHGIYNGEYYIGWDLDHIIPISSATSEEEIYTLNHYTNFQPLCSKINRYFKCNKKDFDLTLFKKENNLKS